MKCTNVFSWKRLINNLAVSTQQFSTVKMVSGHLEGIVSMTYLYVLAEISAHH